MTAEEIVASLNSEDISTKKPVSSAELLAFVGGNQRLKKLKDGIVGGPTDDIKNICDVAVKLIERDDTQFDFDKVDRVAMLDALVAVGIWSAQDKIDLENLATQTQSRASQIGVHKVQVGDVKFILNGG